VFAYFMEKEVPMNDDAIFADISRVIRQALERTRSVNPKKTGIARSSLEIALRQLI
jgi:hypothetical protein